MPFGINSHAAVHVDKLEAIKVFPVSFLTGQAMSCETPVKQGFGRGGGKGTPGVGVAAVAPGIKVDFLHAVAGSIADVGEAAKAENNRKTVSTCHACMDVYAGKGKMIFISWNIKPKQSCFFVSFFF